MKTNSIDFSSQSFSCSQKNSSIFSKKHHTGIKNINGHKIKFKQNKKNDYNHQFYLIWSYLH